MDERKIEKAKNDVKRVIENYLKDGAYIRNIFDKPPHTIYKVEKYGR